MELRFGTCAETRKPRRARALSVLRSTLRDDVYGCGVHGEQNSTSEIWRATSAITAQVDFFFVTELQVRYWREKVPPKGP